MSPLIKATKEIVLQQGQIKEPFVFFEKIDFFLIDLDNRSKIFSQEGKKWRMC